MANSNYPTPGAINGDVGMSYSITCYDDEGDFSVTTTCSRDAGINIPSKSPNSPNNSYTLLVLEIIASPKHSLCKPYINNPSKRITLALIDVLSCLSNGISM